jgi:hypothetical protein
MEKPPQESCLHGLAPQAAKAWFRMTELPETTTPHRKGKGVRYSQSRTVALGVS